jgi:excisionase family DNA binding protein
MAGERDTTATMLNLKQVAVCLDVHYMTAYRYVRQGRLEAEREGTQWRVPVAALEAFRSGGSDDGDTDWAARLERCLLAGDEVAAWRVVDGALAAARTPQYCYVEILASALAHIGSRWEAGELDVADQYVATAVATRIVARLGARFRRPGRRRGTLVFGSPLGELHSLPVALAADLVRLEGFDVLELGANVPPAVFAAAALRAPRLVAVGIGITRGASVPAAQQAVDAVRSLAPDVPVVLGGQGAWDPAATAMTGVSAFALDGSGVASVVATIAARRAADCVRSSPRSTRNALET